MTNYKPNISSNSYKEVFQEKSANSGAILSAIVVIILFSILFGLVGYFIGDRGFLNKNKIQENAKADSYSQEDLLKLIESSDYDTNLYNQIIANLKEKYVDQTKVEDKKLFQGSLKGLVESIGDPATNYFSPEEYKEYLDSFSGTFEGIGVRLEYYKQLIRVEEVFPGSPAEKAGVKVGYVFSKIDGKDVTQETMEDIVSKVRGKIGSEVKITFFDESTNEEVEKSITRGSIEVESIRVIEQDSETAVLEVSRFVENNLKTWQSKWDNAINIIQSKGYKNIILDMRGNGGGYLEAAIYAASDFVEPNKLVLTEKSKISGEEKRFSAKNQQRLKDKKVVILINGNTASASEILAGALKFHNGYKILGTKSFGKGTVQNTYDLPDGGALKITTEYWILPDGKHLDNENPIYPDLEIKQEIDSSKEGKDNVLDKAIEEIKK